VPIASAAKLVVYKQLDARFYSAGAYVGSVLLTHLPIATIESIVFGSITSVSRLVCGVGVVSCAVLTLDMSVFVRACVRVWLQLLDVWIRI